MSTRHLFNPKGSISLLKRIKSIQRHLLEIGNKKKLVVEKSAYNVLYLLNFPNLNTLELYKPSIATNYHGPPACQLQPFFLMIRLLMKKKEF